LTSRAYHGKADLLPMLEFLSSATSAAPPGAYWHPGDVIWGMFQNTVFDPGREVRLWKAGDELLGFAWLEEPDGVMMQVHLRLRGSGSLEGEMLDWAARQTRTVYGGRAGDELWTRVPEDNSRSAAFLTDTGFVRDPDYALKMLRDLDGPLPRQRPQPDEWTVREVGGKGEWEERVEIPREVWNPSRVTLEAYRRLRGAPGYYPWLDLVAVTPDGTFGSYCICWFDPRSRTGLFEPVGTHPEYRGRGLGKAIMLEGLRRLRVLGARAALVTVIHDNEAAARLYDSVGFETVNTERFYGKML
jgi:mycothiol synthase